MTATERLLRDGVETLEPRRQRWLKLFLKAWGVSAAGGVLALGVYSCFPGCALLWGALALTAVVTMFGLSYKTVKQRDEFYRVFMAWRDQAIHQIEERASLAPNQCLPQHHFDGSLLNNRFYNTYGGSNLLTIGDLRCSDLNVRHIYEETYYETVYSTDSQGRTTSSQVQRTRTVVVPIFNGLFLTLPATLPHPGSVILRQELAGTSGSLRRIRVASSHINKAYAIGSTDPFLGHRVLTPALMEALWDFRLKFRSAPSFSFRNGLLYIVVPGLSLGFGEVPGKWSPVTLTKLKRVLSACEASIGFLKATAENLKPS